MRKPITVYHSRLAIVDDMSTWRRECPFCPAGILPVTRHSTTLRLLADDRCLGCGQAVVYADVRKREEK